MLSTFWQIVALADCRFGGLSLWTIWRIAIWRIVVWRIVASLLMIWRIVVWRIVVQPSFLKPDVASNYLQISLCMTFFKVTNLFCCENSALVSVTRTWSPSRIGLMSSEEQEEDIRDSKRFIVKSWSKPNWKGKRTRKSRSVT